MLKRKVTVLSIRLFPNRSCAIAFKLRAEYFSIQHYHLCAFWHTHVVITDARQEKGHTPKPVRNTSKSVITPPPTCSISGDTICCRRFNPVKQAEEGNQVVKDRVCLTAKKLCLKKSFPLTTLGCVSVHRRPLYRTARVFE